MKKQEAVFQLRACFVKLNPNLYFSDNFKFYH